MKEETKIIDRILSGTASASDRARLEHIYAVKAAALKPARRPRRASALLRVR